MPSVKLLEGNANSLVTDVVQVLVLFLQDIGQNQLLIDMLEGAAWASKATMGAIFESVEVVAKLDQYLSWGAGTGCSAVMTDLVDMVKADTTLKPVGLDCMPGVTLETKPASMVAPVMEAAMVGLVTILVDKTHQLLYAPLVAELVSLARTVWGYIQKGIMALCSIPPVAGDVCTAILAAVDTAVGTTLPSLVQDVLNGIFTAAQNFFTSTIPAWTESAVDWFVQDTGFGKKLANLTLTIEDDINGFVGPVAKLFVPIAQDVFALFLPKLEAAFTSCMGQYNGVYKVLQSKWCPAPLAHPATHQASL